MKAKEFLIMFFIQLLDYSIIAINIRVMSDGNYLWSTLTDVAISSFNFFVIKRISQSDDNFHQWAGYATGSAIGTMIGIYISKLIILH